MIKDATYFQGDKEELFFANELFQDGEKKQYINHAVNFAKANNITLNPHYQFVYLYKLDNSLRFSHSYKSIINLLSRAGIFATIYLVNKNDHFEWYGNDPSRKNVYQKKVFCDYQITTGADGKPKIEGLLCVYPVVRIGNRIEYPETIPTDKILDSYNLAKTKNVWQKHSVEMIKKTAVRKIGNIYRNVVKTFADINFDDVKVDVEENDVYQTIANITNTANPAPMQTAGFVNNTPAFIGSIPQQQNEFQADAEDYEAYEDAVEQLALPPRVLASEKALEHLRFKKIINDQNVVIVTKPIFDEAIANLIDLMDKQKNAKSKN